MTAVQSYMDMHQYIYIYIYVCMYVLQAKPI